ncbi:MarR family winged helix-turn-helix transcriptional regulator [Pyruvatibacter sp.]|uniref:MarR family winged helix-turn-helix transcriptional regulator n=1 Tax=Pyruvatibacter sp. TaxID=1981328 RepID=UPI0032EE9FB3
MTDSKNTAHEGRPDKAKPAVAPQPGAGEIEDALAFSALLQEFGRLLSGEYDRRMPMSRGQSAVVALLMEHDGRTVTQLADDLQLHKVSVGAHVDDLAKQGLVERRPHPTDKRSKQVWLTPYFHSVKFLGQGVFTMIHARAIEGISQQDYRHAVKVLTVMRDNLKRLKDETGG